MTKKGWVLALACLALASGCATKQLPKTYADVPYLQSELTSVRDVSLFPFAYYTDQQGLPERLGQAVAEMVMAEVRRGFVERGFRVPEQDLVNRMLLLNGVVGETTEEFVLLPATVKYDLAYIGYSEEMRKLLREYVRAAEHTPEGTVPPLSIHTLELGQEVVAEVGRELGVRLVIRGRIADLGRPIVEPLDYDYSLIPRFIGNRDGVVVRAAYEVGLDPALPEDLRLVEQTILARSRVAEYRALQLRLFAQETGEGRVVWSNTALMTYPAFFESEVDLRAREERLRKTIAKEVKLLLSDLLR